MQTATTSTPATPQELIDRFIPADGPPYIKGTAVAELLGVTNVTVSEMARRGDLPPAIVLGPKKHVYPRAQMRQALLVLLAGSKAVSDA